MYIVYITTNMITQIIYIGVHQQDEPYEFDGYLGSGKRLNDSIKHHGKEQFLRETLFYYETIENAYKKEAEIVTEEFVNADWNYNMIPGGHIPPKMTTESALKAIETKKKNGTWGIGVNIGIKGKKPWCAGKTNVFKPEVIERMKLAKIGKKLPNRSGENHWSYKRRKALNE
jgi:hypothetical protein